MPRMTTQTSTSPAAHAHAAAPNPAGSTIIPSLRYRDAHHMIGWLCTALGFTRNAVFDGPNGTVAHAQLTFGKPGAATGMIMLGSHDNGGELSSHMIQPDATGGRETVLVYLITADAATLFAQAIAAGAEVVAPLRTMDYGGGAFSVRDPEGHIWSVGEYDPWASA